MTQKKSINNKKENSFDIQKLMQSSDSYKSLIYGIVTVVVLFIVIALGVRTLQQNKAQIDDGAVSTSVETQNLSTANYTVVEGDTLWSIAEEKYNDGFSWEKIARANNITETAMLEKGTKLIIPNTKDMETKQAEVTPTTVITNEVNTATAITPTFMQKDAPTDVAQKMNDQKISSTSYIIVEGDTLWDISVRAYGDGYRWSEIAQANNIANADLIYTGNSLNLPRP